MNRKDRRTAIKASAKRARVGWEPLRAVAGATLHPSMPDGLVRALNNHTYAVMVYAEVASPLGLVTPIGIRRHDEGTAFPWHDLQRIKDEVAGSNRVAVEVFPQTTDLVDAADMRWLWVLLAGQRFRFTLRAVPDAS
jgi:hypothetical protein